MTNTNAFPNIKNSRILILQQRGWALRVGHPLAKHLHTQHQAKLAAVTIKPTTHKFVTSQKEVPYENIFDADLIKDTPESVGDLDQVSLTEICLELNIDSIWPLVQASRNHIYNYAKKYYYSYKQGQPDENIIKFFKATFLHVKNSLDTFNPDIVITPNFAGLQHIIYALLCKKREIPIIGTIDTKIKNVTGFAYDHVVQDSSFLRRFHELEAGAVSPNEKRAGEYLKNNREKLTAPFQDLSNSMKIFGNTSHISNKISIKHFIRAIAISMKETLKFYLHTKKNRISTLGVNIDYRPPYYIFRDNIQSIIHRRDHENYDGYTDISSIKKYVYFPLQVQPEATINIHAARFNNQLEVARQVSLCLPDDYCLVVKEHPVMTSQRPISYIDKLANIPNIKVANFSVASDEILRRASLIVSPSSTTISEAAYLNIPAIQLGDLGSTKVYPNVTHHSDFSTLSGVIKNVLLKNNSLPDDIYDTKMINIIAAAYDVGLENSHNVLYSSPLDSFDREAMEDEVIFWFEKEINMQLEKNI